MPLIKAGLLHNGFALLDVLSPCVTFNDHEGSTKSYAYARGHFHPVVHTDFVPPEDEIKVAYNRGEVMPIELHDGSHLLLRKVSDDYQSHNRGMAIEYVRSHQRRGEFVTGLLYIDETQPDLHATSGTVSIPLNELEFADLCPGRTGLDAFNSAHQ